MPEVWIVQFYHPYFGWLPPMQDADLVRRFPSEAAARQWVREEGEGLYRRRVVRWRFLEAGDNSLS